MASCLICSDLLLRQVRSGKLALYCRTCRVEYENQSGFCLNPCCTCRAEDASQFGCSMHSSLNRTASGLLESKPTSSYHWELPADKPTPVAS